MVNAVTEVAADADGQQPRRDAVVLGQAPALKPKNEVRGPVMEPRTSGGGRPRYKGTRTSYRPAAALEDLLMLLFPCSHC